MLRKMRFLGLVGLWGCAGLPFGSSSSGGGSAAEAPPALSGSACHQWAQSMCWGFHKCYGWAVATQFRDDSDCVVVAEAWCGARIALPHMTVTDAQFAACARTLLNATCDDVFNNKPTECAFTGSAATDAPCAQDSQCQSGHCANATGACGVCGPRVGAGVPCTGNAGCAEGLTCNTTAGVCVAYGQRGGTCSGTAPCHYGLSCAAGVCTNPKNVGETCAADECSRAQGAVCNINHVCSLTGLANPGEPCGWLNGQTSYLYCKANGHCRGDVGTTPGVCVAAAGRGLQCDVTNGPNCTGLDKCEQGFCRGVDYYAMCQ